MVLVRHLLSRSRYNTRLRDATVRERLPKHSHGERSLTVASRSPPDYNHPPDGLPNGVSMPRLARNILVTSALPYANGSIHIGHLVEYIQTDIWVRFQRLYGQKVTYVCGDDAHGTPIMLKSQEAGVTPKDWIAKYH